MSEIHNLESSILDKGCKKDSAVLKKHKLLITEKFYIML